MNIISEDFVSVIVPTHNRGALLREAINSIFIQNYKYLEIIVIDDASIDNIKLIVEEFNDSRILYKRLPNNVGNIRARNIGLAMARGKWVAFLDSDDLWKPGKLNAQLSACKSEKYPEKTVVYCQFYDENSEKKSSLRPDRALQAGELVGDYLLLDHQAIQTSCIFLSLKLALATGFDERTRRHADFGFVLRLESAGAAFVMLDAPYVTYRNVPGLERVSGLGSIDASRQWLSVYSNCISAKAAASFRAHQIGTRLLGPRPIEGTIYIISGVLRGGMDGPTAVSLITRRFIPGALIDYLSRTFRKQSKSDRNRSV